MGIQKQLKQTISFEFIDIEKILLILFFAIFSSNNLISQDTLFVGSKGEKFICWIGQFPLHETNTEKGKFRGKIINFIFGKTQNIINKPLNVIASSPESFWVLDQGNGKINQIRYNSFENHKFLNKELKGYTSLLGICYINDNRILFTDSHFHNIYQIDLKKKKVFPLNDSLQLNRPTGIAYSKVTNEIWVVETGLNRILVLNQLGEIKKIIGKRGNGKGEFNFPTFIWIDNAGYIYVVDAMNFRIQIFNKSGEFVSMFGKIGDATGYFARPKGIATDSFGNIYIVDALFHVVQIFDKSGNFLYNFGEQGKDKGQFWLPTGIYIDKKNYIYVADSYNSRIQIFQLVKTESKSDD